MKHNKKRNTAFLYECLIKELTRSVVREDKDRQSTIKSILKEYFSSGTVLSKELAIYKELLETKDISERHHNRLLKESRIDFDSLDRKSVFNSQTSLINKINKQLGTGVYSNFVPNYKDIATVGLFFQNNSLPARKRIILEERMLELLCRQETEEKEMSHVDNLTYKAFVNRFNETYDRTLRTEQKELLTNYITSFSDNGLGLKSYLNEEIGRLKSAVDIEIVENTNSGLTENFKKVRAKLDDYAQKPLNQQIIEEIFYIQDLIAEVRRNGN
tara:strand:- start:1007 stop:1822 length:816 start_codon:yes stop_codon:yes gene_type:complete